MNNNTEWIPVFRPRLPTANLLLPYLQQIDEARWYSNFGPLLVKFEHRLADHFEVLPSMVTTASNGTLMLVAILKALNIPQNTLCVMPSWTFVATAAAACYAGLIPYFIDVDRNSQALNPDKLDEQLSAIKEPIGAIITVSPFGAPIDRKKWDNFTTKTGIPVVIDAAAAFDSINRMSQMSVGTTPMMVSLHATKVLGVGEAGFVLSTNTDLVKRIKAITSFGFHGNRESHSLGFNAKISEYTAAVGLAALDQWQNTRNQWECIRNEYMRYLHKLKIDSWMFSEWVGSTCNVILPEKANLIGPQLKEGGIDTRKWWNNGCHREQAYQNYPKAINLTNTSWLSESVLGLPFSIDLDSKNIEKICYALEAILDSPSMLQPI